jgi:hypothetical protein
VPGGAALSRVSMHRDISFGEWLAGPGCGAVCERGRCDGTKIVELCFASLCATMRIAQRVRRAPSAWSRSADTDRDRPFCTWSYATYLEQTSLPAVTEVELRL